MKKFCLGILLILLTFSRAFPQISNFLSDPVATEQAKRCIELTYDFSFDEAKILQKSLHRSYPEHPAPDFLEGLIIYWEHFPLMAGDPAVESFIDIMDEAVRKADLLNQDNEYPIEGVFFDLFGRAFKAMFWADNGKYGKLIPDLHRMYSNMLKGFDLKDDFVEFYFSCGLYNYYIEAYPDAHPASKPLLAFMRDGDRELGLLQLQYAIDNCIYLKAEALLFMSIIQLDYEADPDAASEYAAELYRNYPHNAYYWGHLIVIQLHRGKYEDVKLLLAKNSVGNSKFKKMITLLAEAFIGEQTNGNKNMASQKYEACLEIAEDYDDLGDMYKAICYMGLSRIAGSDHNISLREKYRKEAEKHTRYKIILDGPPQGSR